MDDSGMIGAFKLEVQTVPGNGKLTRTGAANTAKIKYGANIALNYFKANSQPVSAKIYPNNFDFLVQLLDLQGVGVPSESGLALFISLCSVCLKRSVQTQLAIFGEMTLGGTISPVRNECR
ncbi:hypothetical protein DSM106972_040620 [Dulcicalothrix desertica PCC 7102]|uniref:Lon proteolytic domain-containing protein n=3 Tax=Dulcicalothrix desertica TaxID=32056 RepID=A0A433VGL4_9CYAN|nr:hypothetical protein DSM106972_040620 [Dulcicalothrix desertica PCC 7102]